jgi:hypothetical protein
MTTSTHTKRRLVTLAAIAGAMSMFAPIANGSDIVRSPDAIDRAVKAQQAEIYANVDAREHPVLSAPRTSTPSPDVVERAVRAHQEQLASELSSMPDVVERTAAAGPEPYYSQSTSAGNGFDWSDFIIGAGVGIGSMLVLVGLGSAILTRRSREQVKTA